MAKKKIVVKDDDPNKDFKLEILELIEKEIRYIVNKTLVRVLIWLVLVIVPVSAGWSIMDYNRGQSIRTIENNWYHNDSIIKAVGKTNIKSSLNLKLLDETCEKVRLLEERKVDKETLKEWTEGIQKQLDRSRQFESEILKRQDLMLQHLLDIKRNI